jgi:DNA-binding CsgD family transcriptional regulator
MNTADKVFDRLVRLCYESVLSDASWHEVLATLAEVAGHEQGLLLFRGKSDPAGTVSSLLRLDAPGGLAGNDWQREMRLACLFGDARKVGNWYHQVEKPGQESFGNHSDQPCSFSSIKLHQQPEAGLLLTLVTEKKIGSPDSGQRKLLDSIAPHLVRAAGLSERLAALQLQVATRNLMLDLHPTPVWLVSPRGERIYCNGAAERCLSQAGFPLRECQGQLHCKIHDARLRHAFGLASGMQGAARASLLSLGPSYHQQLLISPAPKALAAAFCRESFALLACLEGVLPAVLLTDLFQLTPAELRLTELVTQGHTLEECSACLEISINTVRSQLRSVFCKTGTSRQAELACLIVRLGAC